MRVVDFFRRRKHIQTLKKADEAQYERDIDLAMLAPTAARLVAGCITPGQAQETVNELASQRQTVGIVWRAMTAQDRERLGRDMLIICATPKHKASIGNLSEELRKANPPLWERAVQAGENNDELSASGRRLLLRIAGSTE